MRLHLKVTVFLLVILLSLSLIILAVGFVSLDRVVQELSSELLAQEVKDLQEEVEDAYHTLQLAGVVTSPQYIRQAQDALLKRFLQRPHFFPSEEVMVISYAGEVLMHPERDYRSIMPDAKMQQLMGQADARVFRYEGQSNRYVAARARFPAWEWLIVIRVQEDEVFHKRNQYAWQMFILSLGLMLFTLVIARHLAGRVVRATQRSLHCINQAANGKLSARIQDISGRDEMADLARGINAMLARREGVENQLVQANVQIQQVNRELQQALTQAQQMSLLAEQASGAKSRFLAMMSHELRTPLNAILGYTQVLAQQPQSESVADGLAVIQDSSEYLLALINNLLDLAKIEAGKLELQQERFAFAEWLGSIERQIAIKARLKGLGLSCQYQQLPTWVYADPVKLKQILLNLLGNAVKFTEQGQVSLAVSQDDSGVLLFKVMDTGCGIAKADMDHLFHPFGQVGGVATRHLGTGLGLTISQQLVRLMGGELRVESTPGQGSCFYFQLLLATEGVETSVQSQAAAPSHWPELPAALYTQLQESVRLGNMQTIKELSLQVEELAEGQELAIQLRSLAQQYRSRELSILIQALAVQRKEE